MRVPLLLLAALTLSVATRAQAAETRRDLTLAPGEQRMLPGEGVDALSTGTPGVVEVRVTEDQKQIVLVGVAPGTTSLLVLMQNGARYEYAITVSRVRARRNVRLDVYFVQLSRRRALDLGILWPGSVAATVTGQAIVDQAGKTAASASVISQVLPRLDLAQTQGWAKVLDQARVVVANGEEGTYTSGGELNVRIATGFAAQLQKIAFGTNIAARLAYDDVTGRIEGRLKAEVSRLVPTQGADTLPGKALVQVSTTVNLELGQSIALAGLFQEDERLDVTGLPGLSQIPVLGLLFGRRASSQERTENIIFIVPTLVDAVPLEQRDRVAEAFALYRSWEGAREPERAAGPLSEDALVRPAPPPRETPPAPVPPARGRRTPEAP